jgi:quinol monooxygenase YgiN
VMKEPGCEQFEMFRSVVDPDKLAILERWTDQAALDAHCECKAPVRCSSRSCARATPSAKTTFTIGPGNPALYRE